MPLRPRLIGAKQSQTMRVQAHVARRELAQIAQDMPAGRPSFSLLWPLVSLASKAKIQWKRLPMSSGEDNESPDFRGRNMSNDDTPDDLSWDSEFLNRHREAAQAGDAEAQYLFGEAHTMCLDFEPDYAEAIKWWRKAADQQHAPSCLSLGSCYEEGKGVPCDQVEAAKWFRKAAELGHEVAQFWLGMLYRRGVGVPRDNDEAAKWFRKAADQGVSDAQYNLGHLYLIGRGVPKNEAEAAAWFLKAAEQGQVDAQFGLGLMYESGRGVPKDIEEAVRLFRRAAEQGEEAAQEKLRDMGLDSHQRPPI